MDRFDEMRVFARVVETRGFRKAAHILGMPASTVTDAVKRAEQRLGARLLDRTTRRVSPTPEGADWYRRCLAILNAVEDAEAVFRGGEPEGLLRIDAHGKLARHFLIPGLPDFLARHPRLDLFLSEGDRLVDPIREGADCVIRVGTLGDGDLMVRRLGDLAEVTVASPAYLDRHGHPRSIDDLEGHRAVAFHSSATGMTIPLEFNLGDRVVERTVPAAITVTAGETMVAAARQGMGLIQVPRYHLAEDLATGRLVEVLPRHPPTPSPVSALYPRDRQLSPRLRVFLDWLKRIDFG
ncbi:LysR family transcriptional regulator [Marivibrio halodurans]|uniref:LysR family transcriptional regulator n=1 Tax=Marivibrio halodurans TaxID=2039722 RepID=A0A8J7V269_9PROT|nr:LysR family transcriptional regulator [Marivibrio halodurans]MBP5858526.1 LysR family transcriptional regulator [Marivibrio halodurans]